MPSRLRHPPPHHPQNPGRSRLFPLTSTSVTKTPGLPHPVLSLFPSTTPNSWSVCPTPTPLVMASTSLFRLATRAVRPSSFVRASQLPRSRVQTPVALAINRPSFSTTSMCLSGAHEEETYEEFSARYAVTFQGPLDVCGRYRGKVRVDRRQIDPRALSLPG